MRSLSQLLLPAWLLVPTVFGADLGDTCDDMTSGVWASCTATYDHPTGYKRKLCSDGCVTDDIIFGDNRRAVIMQDISPSGSSYTAVRAKETDMDLYKKFADTIKSCYTTGCDRQAIGDFFAVYIQDSDEMADGAFVRMLSDWVNLFADIKIKVAAIKSTAKGVQTRLKTVSAKVTAVKKNACKGTACKGSVAATYLKQVSNTLAAVKHLEGMLAVVTRAENAHTAIQGLNYMAINGAKYKPDNDYLYSLIRDSIITDMGDLIWGFEVAKLMPQIAAKLKVEIVPIGSLSQWSTHSTEALKKVNVILAKNFKNHKDLSKTAALRKVRDGFISIQGSVKKELRDPLIKLTTQLKALDTALSKFPLRKKKLDWEVGSSSYKRWTVNSYNLPCLVMMRQPYNYDGYSTYVDYPTFETCQSDLDLIYLPNHHIPWIKYRFIT
ncbi:hypothetical protein G7Z17_g7261 [Cylindrodendrum hubeiense]|uniref:Uncharacterized protein n=1 Tax=Cylindrodendrum hubeiense TaxID=595255 RepID=A0A9P5H5T3_9HYPO|nr:hypothetical protein G7Z17_g7261 [Cylindrodendrum hubeiense]